MYYLPLMDVTNTIAGTDPDTAIIDVQSWYPWGNQTGANGTFALVSTMVRVVVYVKVCKWGLHWRSLRMLHAKCMRVIDQHALTSMR